MSGRKKKKKKNWFPIVNVKVTNEGLYNQNMTISTVFQTAGPVATKLGLIVQHYKPECHAKQKLFAVFKVTVTARAHIIKILL